MTIRIAGTIKAIFYNQTKEQVVFVLQDHTKYTLDVPSYVKRNVLESIGLTQPGDEVNIVASAPDLSDSEVKTWENVTLTRWLSSTDDQGPAKVAQ
jgi:hypothetical protein